MRAGRRGISYDTQRQDTQKDLEGEEEQSRAKILEDERSHP
jgi:hypothetical protein